MNPPFDSHIGYALHILGGCMMISPNDFPSIQLKEAITNALDCPDYRVQGLNFIVRRYGWSGDQFSTGITNPAALAYELSKLINKPSQKNYLYKYPESSSDSMETTQSERHYYNLSQLSS